MILIITIKRELNGKLAGLCSECKNTFYFNRIAVQRHFKVSNDDA